MFLLFNDSKLLAIKIVMEVITLIYSYSIFKPPILLNFLDIDTAQLIKEFYEEYLNDNTIDSDNIEVFNVKLYKNNKLRIKNFS
ncbi:hypothetical protein ETSB_0136 [cyanobacterium endosymbiont of Epithemia turgida isolate EtSB Lake Yunoko]|nr:hypothetical protein ETSB_0136 [cyanobacterium endosymbiont of Epithemia turgida isolate EtSB Lake Yunoko]